MGDYSRGAFNHNTQHSMVYTQYLGNVDSWFVLSKDLVCVVSSAHNTEPQQADAAVQSHMLQGVWSVGGSEPHQRYAHSVQEAPPPTQAPHCTEGLKRSAK